MLLADALQVPAALLGQAAPARRAQSALPWRAIAAALLTATLLGGMWSLDRSTYAVAGPAPHATPAPPTSAPAPHAQAPALVISAPAAERVAPAPTAAPTAPAAAGPLAQAPPADQAPRACPLLAEPERVLVTQGYGEGTHAPGPTAGGLDLAIDADADGRAEPDSTRGLVVLATQSGVAHVYLNTWPGGNVVQVTDEQTGWGTLYAHLDLVAVADGARVEAGRPVGTIGMTGMTSGPHLHYEIRYAGTNLDPIDMAPCWRRP
jgi:murein DD-endopeptidase MepM/ murein hydrolase activator NlpD